MALDDEIRQLERRHAKTGAVADEVELIRARLRTGRIEQRHVGAAAWLRYEPAGVLAPKDRDKRSYVHFKRLEPFERWLERLGSYGDDVLMRAALAALAAVMARPDAERPLDPEELEELEERVLRDGPQAAPRGDGHDYLRLALRGLARFSNDSTFRIVTNAIRDEVIPWAVGARDPLRERAEGERPEVLAREPEEGGEIPF